MISGKTAIYGIFGHPVKHTFSPGMHNTAFKILRLDACYVPFDVAPSALGDAVKAVRALGVRGLNITVPHKEQVIPYLDSLSEEARLVGAVNTIEVLEGKLVGHNTDGRGFLRSLKQDARFTYKNKTFLIIGSGGAARAVGFSLAISGAAKLFLFDIDQRKAGSLAGDIRKRAGADARAISGKDLAEAARAADCIINATPLGLKSTDQLPIPRDLIQKRHLVCDLVYNPPKTPLLQLAKQKGARCLPGIGMLLYQGVIAFEIWTGEKAPQNHMKAALQKQLRERRR